MKIIYLLILITISYETKNYERFDLYDDTLLTLAEQNKNYLLSFVLSNHTKDETINFFLKIPKSKDYSSENITFFTLDEIIKLEEIEIPENTFNISLKKNATNDLFYTYFIEHKINNEKQIIFLIDSITSNEKIYAMITKLDESNRYEIQLNEEKKLDLNNKPLFFVSEIQNIKEDINTLYFIFDCEFDLLNNSIIKLNKSNDDYEAFPPIQSTNLVNPLNDVNNIIFQLKNGENNYSLYLQIEGKKKSVGVILETEKKGFINLKKVTYNLLINQTVNYNFIPINVGNQKKLLVIESSSSIDNSYFYVIKQNNNDNLDFYYSYYNDPLDSYVRNYDLKKIDCETKLSNNEKYNYCNFTYNFPTMKSQLFFYSNSGILNIRNGKLKENFIHANDKFKDNFISNLHYSIGFSNNNESIYMKIIASTNKKIKFRTYLISKEINEIFEINEEPIVLNNFYFSLDDETYYYFEYMSNEIYKSLIYDIISNDNCSISFEKTLQSQNSSDYYNISRNEEKEITNKHKFVFIELNVSEFNIDNEIYLTFSGPNNNKFNNSKFYFVSESVNNESFNGEQFISVNCKNSFNETSFTFYCDFKKKKYDTLKLILSLKEENVLFKIKNTQNNPIPEEKNDSSYLIIIIIIVAIVLFGLILIFSFAFRTKRVESAEIDVNMSI